MSRAILFSATAVVGLLWILHLFGLGYYGVHLSWWLIPLVLGSVINLSAAVKGLFRADAWSASLQLLGSTLLAVFFFPASPVVLDFRGGLDFAWLVRALTVLLVVFALAVALWDIRRVALK